LLPDSYRDQKLEEKLVPLPDSQSTPGCKLRAEPARWPEPNAAVARNVGGSHAYAEAPADRHIWLLISASGRIKIFVSFLYSRQKENK
jgi:hypothetical protein